MTTQTFYQYARATGGALSGLVAGASFVSGDIFLCGLFTTVSVICIASVYDRVEDDDEPEQIDHGGAAHGSRGG